MTGITPIFETETAQLTLVLIPGNLAGSPHVLPHFAHIIHQSTSYFKLAQMSGLKSFLANLMNSNRESEAIFRVSGLNLVLWVSRKDQM